MQKFLLSFVVVLVGSVTIATTIFLNQTPEPVQAALSASCSTGFDRPLLFGIGHAFDSSSLQTIPEAGGTFVTQGVAWDSAEKTKGQVDESAYRSFDLWRDRAPNIVVLGNVSGTPEWARDNPALPVHKAQPRRNDPEVEARFRNFINTLVTRNKDKVKYWSYWNEPNGCQSNHHTGSCAWDDNTADSYVHWLNIFYDEVKKADPSAQVLGGELEMIKNVDNYVQAMNERDAKYDFLAIHPYDKEKEAAFPLGWAKSAYEAQRLQNGKRPPVFVTEWGWDGNWSGVDDATISRRIAEAFEMFKQNTWIQGASYHAMRDVGGGEYGLRGSDGLRPRGLEFQRLSQQICGVVGGVTPPVTAGNPPNKPIVNNEIPITIRTHYRSSSLNNVPPKIGIYLNNYAGFDGPYDFSACDGTYTGPAGNNNCGQLNKYENKLIETFDASGSVKDITINASQLVPNLVTGVSNTKLSYAFSNDESNASGDRNFTITKIEIFGPATDNSNQSKLLLTFSPDTSDSYYGGYTSNSCHGNFEKCEQVINSSLLNSFYFDMGFIEPDGTKNANNDGMIKGFDKREIKTIKETQSRENKEWRLHQEGTFNFVSQEIQKIIRTIYSLNSVQAACVVASHDIGSDALKRGQPVTFTAVASTPVKTFKFAFYNNDNKDSAGIPRPFCVRGGTEVAGDACPDGSGQLVIEANSNNNREGAIQAASWLPVNNYTQVVESIWKGDMGWNRTLPLNDDLGNINGTAWNFSSYLGIETFGRFRSTAEIDAQDFYNLGRTSAMEIWRNNIGTRTTFSLNAAGNYPNWSTAETSEIANLTDNPTAMPGSGVISAAGSILTSNSLWQVYWRSGEEWIRSVPRSNTIFINYRDIDAQPNRGYSLSRTISSLPKPGTKVQAINFIVMPNGKVQEHIWQDDQMYKRTIPITNNAPDFANATPYQPGAAVNNITPSSELTTSVTAQYNQVRQIDMLTNKMPENVQVNATFVTTFNEPVRDDGKCVVRFIFDRSLEGDVDGNCVVDIYDYNLLLQYYNQSNCQYNLTGNDCKIDTADIDYLKERFGQKCVTR